MVEGGANAARCLVVEEARGVTAEILGGVPAAGFDGVPDDLDADALAFSFSLAARACLVAMTLS